MVSSQLTPEKSRYLYSFGSLVYNQHEVIKMATDRPRYSVSVDNDLFKQIEDFRFEHRFQTRSEATVELIRLGLESLRKEREKQQKAVPEVSETDQSK